MNKCSVEPADIHYFKSITDDTLPGHATVTFESSGETAIAFRCLYDKQLTSEYKLKVNLHRSNRSKKSVRGDYDGNINEIFKEKNIETKVLKLHNLHWKTTENDIIRFLKPITDKTDEPPSVIHIARDAKGYPDGSAKVEFETTSLAQRVMMQLNGQQILNRNVTIEPSKSKRIFTPKGQEFKGRTVQCAIFNIAGGVMEDDLTECIVSEIGEEYAPIDIHLIHHLKVWTPGYAFCKFNYPEDVDKVVEELNGKILEGRELNVQWSKMSQAGEMRMELRGKTRGLRLNNIRYDVTEESIRAFLGEKLREKVEQIQIMENAKGFRYGMAKLVMKSENDAVAVEKKCNGKELNGRTVNIKYDRESAVNRNRQWNNKRGRGGSRGRGRGRGMGRGHLERNFKGKSAQYSQKWGSRGRGSRGRGSRERTSAENKGSKKKKKTRSQQRREERRAAERAAASSKSKKEPMPPQSAMEKKTSKMTRSSQDRKSANVENDSMNGFDTWFDQSSASKSADKIKRKVPNKLLAQMNV